MTLSSASRSPPPEWKFSQVFGKQAPGEDVQDVDIISAMGFDASGDYLAVGDRGGRVVIFERKDGKHVKEMDPYPYVSSENALLAESSFMTEQDKPSVPNGSHPERMENMAKSISPSQDRHVEN